MEMLARHHQAVALKYIKWDDKYLHEKPFQLYVDIPIEVPNSVRGNVSFEDGPVEQIQDARGKSGELTLDSHGFAFIDFATEFSSWEDPAAVQRDFYDEISKLLKERVEGGDFIHPFEYRVGENLSPTAMRAGKHTYFDTDNRGFYSSEKVTRTHRQG